MIEKTRPIYEVYYNVTATPTMIKPPPGGTISGCLYTNEGKIISLSQRYGGYLGDFFSCADHDAIIPDDFTNISKIIKGRSIYLGHYMQHYGHFLVEMLSSFWMYDNFRTYDHFIFHPFVFGDKVPEYIQEAFNAFGIPLNLLVIISEYTIIEEVTVPERLIKLNKSANIKVKEVYDFLARFFDKGENNINKSKRYYISRVRVNMSKGNRAVLNEPLIQSNLSRMGFTIIYPELLSFSEQISLIYNAKVVCGLSGSALHNCLFMKNNSVLIEIGDARSADGILPMQQICNEVSDAICYFIDFDGYILDLKKQVSLLRSKKISKEIEKILIMNGLQCENIYDMQPPKQNNPLTDSVLMVLLNCLRLIKWKMLALISLWAAS